MRKIISVFCAALIAMSALSACGNASVKSAAESKKIRIVTTIFPEYEWVMAILGDNTKSAEVTMLLDNGVDLHSYQPTAEDILKVATCDLFIYVGGESDGWVKDALKETVNKDMIVINLLESLGDRVKEEEITEGMEHDHDHGDGNHEDSDHDHEDEHHEDSDHDHANEHHEDGEIEYDEHVWLSLENAGYLCDVIEDAIAKIDPENADAYQQNADAYRDKLGKLNDEYKKVVDAASTKTILFGDRFPFRYLVDDYGLDYYAAFAGCSAETEASFETITFLAGKVDELGLTSIFTIEGSDKKIAETIRDNTKTKDQEIVTLDSMQSTTSEDVKNGADYLSGMESNLEVLKKALN